MSSSCSAYTHSLVLSFFLLLLLVAGIFVLYVPQYLRVYGRRLLEGILPMFLFLGTASGTCASVNLVLLTQEARHCCSVLSPFDCVNLQMGMIQVVVQAVSAGLILVCCVAFTHPSRAEAIAAAELLEQELADPSVDPDSPAVETPMERYSKLTTTAQVCSFHVGLSVAAIVYGLRTPATIPTISALHGIASTVFGTLQYLPQLRITWILKHPGTLSIPMMCLQTPGGFLWAGTMMARPGSHWSLWLPYLTAACLQGTLLAMCIVFERRLPASAPLL